MSNSNEIKGGGVPPSTTSAAGAHEEFLPDDLLWADGGHASDVVLTALADGQRSIVPNGVRVHVEHCASCMGHLGNAALLSLHADRELNAKVVYERSLLEATRRPLPRLAIALGLAAAALGVVPSIIDDADGTAARTFVTHQIPLFIKGIGTLAGHVDSTSFGVIVTYAAAAMLVVMGFAVVRFLPKKETSQ
jgi:hypothetical protein